MPDTVGSGPGGSRAPPALDLLCPSHCLLGYIVGIHFIWLYSNIWYTPVVQNYGGYLCGAALCQRCTAGRLQQPPGESPVGENNGLVGWIM